MRRVIRDTFQYWREVIAENWQSASTFKKSGQTVAWLITTGLTLAGSLIWVGTVEKIFCSIPLVLWLLWLLFVAPVSRNNRQRDKLDAINAEHSRDETLTRLISDGLAVQQAYSRTAGMMDIPNADERLLYDDWTRDVLSKTKGKTLLRARMILDGEEEEFDKITSLIEYLTELLSD